PDADGELRTTLSQELHRVPGYHGGEVSTSQSFHAFLIWFEAVARSLDGRTTLFNCTEGGAHIRGMEHRPLEEVATAYCREEFEVAPVLDRAASSVDVAPRRASMANHVRGMLDALAPCLELAERCQRLAAGAAKRPKLLHKLQAAERELSGALKPVRFLSLMAQNDILKAQEQASAAKTLEENLEAARLLFSVVERAGDKLRAPLEKALDELSGDAG
ncbi:MAG: hypothetical protein O7B99_10155, partial [Planctomycetota bacterium]|nr:hypothetical protein [Planctomycetota bacterium]